MTSNFPHFIQEHLVFVSDIHLSRKHHSTIALLKSLQLYELQHKHVLNSIDLQKSVLSKVRQKIEELSPVLDATRIQENDVVGSSMRCSNTPVGDINLGKYVYQNRHFKRIYIILKCWNSLVIIQKTPEGFTLDEEYKGVESFEIFKGNNYESKLAISFLDSDQNIVTNLQKKAPIAAKSNVTAIRRAEDVIKMKQSELLVHKTITKKVFSKLRNSNVFGNNFLRTPRLDEMRILSKCSDAWLKLNADDDIVIGVPLVNNCCARLTILRNLRGVLQCSGSGDLNYTFAIYQQSTTFSSVERIKSFFESEHSHEPHNFDWSQCKELLLRPETFYVLIFKINIKEIVDFNALDLLLFVFYDVSVADRIFSQKSFLANISFQNIFANDTYKINFHSKHLHRDLLSVVSTSYKLEILLEYNHNDAIFREYLCSGMDFFEVTLPESDSETMNVDECDKDIEVQKQPTFFYNKNPNSLWHGTLIAITKGNDNCSTAKIFTKTQEKSIVFLRYLEIELQTKCGINKICYDCRNMSTKLVQFESVLRDECKSYLKLLSSKRAKIEQLDIKEVQRLHQDLYLNELKTDLWLKELNS